MNRSVIALLGVACLSTMVIAEPAKTPEVKKPEVKAPEAKKALDIVDTAASDPQFSTLVGLIKDAGLVDALKKGEFTVFAPTNEAFKKVPAETMAALGKDKELLKAVLTYHVVPAKVMAKDVKAGDGPKTVQGTAFTIEVKDGKVSVGNKQGMATVTKTDIVASNGVIHVIDSVIVPMPADKKGEKPAGEAKPEKKSN
jgi:transforming growth factor-beta-induced protein